MTTGIDILDVSLKSSVEYSRLDSTPHYVRDGRLLATYAGPETGKNCSVIIRLCANEYQGKYTLRWSGNMMGENCEMIFSQDETVWAFIQEAKTGPKGSVLKKTADEAVAIFENEIVKRKLMGITPDHKRNIYETLRLSYWTGQVRNDFT